MAAKAAAKPVPEKLFYRIQEVARMAGVKPHVLRYWESEFPQLAPRKDMNDQRRYTKKDIDLVLRIKTLLYSERFTIAGAKRQLRRTDARRQMLRTVDADFVSALRRDISDLLSLLDSEQADAA